MEKIRLLLVDDDAQICKSIKIILSKEETMEVVAFAHDGKEAILKYEEFHPDLVLMDIRMPIKTGIEAAEEILCKDPNAKILLLSTFSDEEYVVRAFQIGVRGYIIKQEYKKIAPAVKSVINGQFVFADEVISTLPKFIMQFRSMNSLQKKSSIIIEDFSPEREKSVSNLRLQYDLSQKEMKIIELVALGLTNKEIADEMHFSSGTIRNYISDLLEKLDLKNRTQLASFYSNYLE